MDKCIIDTDIFSEFLRGKNKSVVDRATAYISEHTQLAVAVMTVVEVTSGYHRTGRAAHLHQFVAYLANVIVLELTEPIARLAGEIHGQLASSGTPIGIADITIAATAIHHELTLITGNTSHYIRIVERGFPLKLDNWKD